MRVSLKHIKGHHTKLGTLETLPVFLLLDATFLVRCFQS